MKNWEKQVATIQRWIDPRMLFAVSVLVNRLHSRKFIRGIGHKQNLTEFRVRCWTSRLSQAVRPISCCRTERGWHHGSQ